MSKENLSNFFGQLISCVHPGATEFTDVRKNTFIRKGSLWNGMESFVWKGFSFVWKKVLRIVR
jgi:hypothetical protein